MKHAVLFQKIESVAIFATLLAIYGSFGFSWLWFVLLLFTPDVFMVGYLKDPKIGAFFYNMGHSYFSPIILGFLGSYFGPTVLIRYAVIWAAHVAMDRMFGFGLKLPDGFKHTHMGQLK